MLPAVERVIADRTIRGVYDHIFRMRRCEKQRAARGDMAEERRHEPPHVVTENMLDDLSTDDKVEGPAISISDGAKKIREMSEPSVGCLCLNDAGLIRGHFHVCLE